MTVGAGDVIAEKYRVERLLGRGGMGYVVAARHMTIDQLVAIKFLRKRAISDEGALARFRQEAKACVRLRSEHVARVIDVGLHGDEPYIVMEHLAGADLGLRAEEGHTFSIAETCDYIIQACEGLAEAHALGIIHRDIKLPNLFLTSTAAGEPLLKVLDFGVSKTLSAGKDRVNATQTMACLGSPKYMSPEQMNDARDVDARTDVWSLGVCLYRMIAGRAPFDGDTIGRVCTMVLHEVPPSISAIRPDIPALLEAIIACCMQKDRDYRFGNVAELAAALAPFASAPDRAMKATAHIATVLGVGVPAPGSLPPPPAVSMPGGFDGVAAWAHTTGRRPAYRRPVGGHHRIWFAAAAFLALAVATKAYLPSPRNMTRSAFGASARSGQPPRPAAVMPVAVPAFAPANANANALPNALPNAPMNATAIPSAPSPTTAVAAPAPLPPPAVTFASPDPVPAAAPAATPRRRTRVRSGGKVAKPREDEALTGVDPAAIPSDRK